MDTLKSMDQPAPSNQLTIVTHAVLAGLTPLIPIPLIDDLILNYFRRRMVRSLAAAHGQTLPAHVTEALTASEDKGWMWGCLTAAVIYPLKALFRKIFFILEWKRVVDLTSRTYHDGFLLNEAFAQGWIGPEAPVLPAQVNAAILDVCRTAPIKPIETAVRVAFRQSRSALVGGARMLERQFRRLRSRPDDEQVATAVEAIEPAEEQELAGVIASVQREIEKVSSGHFDWLRSELARRLSVPEGQ